MPSGEPSGEIEARYRRIKTRPPYYSSADYERVLIYHGISKNGNYYTREAVPSDFDTWESACAAGFDVSESAWKAARRRRGLSV